MGGEDPLTAGFFINLMLGLTKLHPRWLSAAMGKTWGSTKGERITPRSEAGDLLPPLQGEAFPAQLSGEVSSAAPLALNAVPSEGSLGSSRTCSCPDTRCLCMDQLP